MTATTTPVCAGVRAGLALSVVLGASNSVFLFDPGILKAGTTAAPHSLLVPNAVLGLVVRVRH